VLSSFLLVVLFVLGLFIAACGNPSGSGGSSPSPTPSPTPGTGTGSKTTYYTVTFDAKGGSPAPKQQSVAKGGTVSEPAESMTKAPESSSSLYTGVVTFKYWYSTDEATAYTFNAPVNSSFTLHAKWEEPASSVDISGQSGNNTLEKAMSYISGQSGTEYTIVLDADCTMTNTTTINKLGAVITLTGKSPTTISIPSNGNLFNINVGKLILDNNITLKGNDVSNSNSVVYVSNASGSLTMKAGATISGNYVNNRGGGVYVYKGSFTMEGGKISGNEAGSGGGGGVYVVDGSFTMAGGEISGNEAGSGGGVYLFHDTSSVNFSKIGGVISGNTASQGNTYGRSVYYNINGTDYYYCDTDLGENDEISTEASKLPTIGTDFNWTKK
jgi:hypothetical protein